MNFDWLNFFESLGVDYVIGPAVNVRAGNVGIQCPQCGGDTKYHFSVELDSGKTRGCWRDSEHWMSPTDLVAELAGINWMEAKELMSTGDVQSGNSPQALLKKLEEMETTPVVAPCEVVASLPEFKPFVRKGAVRQQAPFWKYMVDRGFDNPVELSEQFGVAWCSRGEWQNRVIIPIYFADELVGWTARAITPSRMKYKAHPSGDVLQGLLLESKDIEPTDVLVIVEGPTDMLRIGLLPGVCCVALMTNSAGVLKLRRLVELAAIARRTVIMLDEGAEAQALRLQTNLAMVGAEVVFEPGDPGSMSRKRAEEWLSALLVA